MKDETTGTSAQAARAAAAQRRTCDRMSRGMLKLRVSWHPTVHDVVPQSCLQRIEQPRPCLFHAMWATGSLQARGSSSVTAQDTHQHAGHCTAGRAATMKPRERVENSMWYMYHHRSGLAVSWLTGGEAITSFAPCHRATVGLPDRTVRTACQVRANPAVCMLLESKTGLPNASLHSFY
jgi:hypothetical protein